MAKKKNGLSQIVERLNDTFNNNEKNTETVVYCLQKKCWNEQVKYKEMYQRSKVCILYDTRTEYFCCNWTDILIYIWFAENVFTASENTYKMK